MRLRNDQRELRRIQAAERQAYFSSCTRTEKIARLNQRLGVNVGAKREREKYK